MTDYDPKKWGKLCNKYRGIMGTLNSVRVVTARKKSENDAANKAWDEFDEACKEFEDVRNNMEEFRKEITS